MISTKARPVRASLILAFAGLSLLLNDQGRAVSIVRGQNRFPQRECSVATLRGNYGNWFQFLDAVHYPFGGLEFTEGFTPGAGLGTDTFDGQGNYVGEATISFGGAIVSAQFSGTYTVNPNCTGSMVLSFVDGGTSNLNLVIVDKGKEVHTLSADANHTAFGTLKRQ